MPYFTYVTFYSLELTNMAVIKIGNCMILMIKDRDEKDSGECSENNRTLLVDSAPKLNPVAGEG